MVSKTLHRAAQPHDHRFEQIRGLRRAARLEAAQRFGNARTAAFGRRRRTFLDPFHGRLDIAGQRIESFRRLARADLESRSCDLAYARGTGFSGGAGGDLERAQGAARA